MSRVKAVRGLDNHLRDVLGRLRALDEQELRSAHGESPDKVMTDTWMQEGADRWALQVDGVTVGLFGVNPGEHEGNYGVPWLLGTDDISKADEFLITKSRLYLEFMLCRYRILINYVDARSLKSLMTWLKWTGFIIHDAYSYGAEGLPFHMITKER